MSHTRGPWTFSPDTYAIERDPSDGLPIRHALVIGPNGENAICVTQGEWEDDWDNARLIAAAPDLLEALEALVAAWDEPNHRSLGTAAEYIKAGVAIARARGISVEEGTE